MDTASLTAQLAQANAKLAVLGHHARATNDPYARHVIEDHHTEPCNCQACQLMDTYLASQPHPAVEVPQEAQQGLTIAS